MSKGIGEKFETFTSNYRSMVGRGIGKSASARSRMKKCWRLIRARRRSSPLTASTLGSYHSTDRYQMSFYIL